MSNLINLINLGYGIGGKTLFVDLNATLNKGDRVGLVGHNGSGKSSLLTLIANTKNAGIHEADSGIIQSQRGLRIAQVEQFLPDKLNAQRVVDAVDTDRWQAEALLGELGFQPDQLSLSVEQLSGGQQNRLMFARAITQDADVVLLDEPTNHLDLATIVLFENHLKKLRAAMILVSHDRAFLDAVTNTTWILRDQKIYHFDLPYSLAREALDKHDEAAEHRLEQEENKIEALRRSAKRLNEWGKVYDNEKLARRGQAIDKRADKLEANKTFTTKGSGLSLSLNLGETRAKEIVRVEDLNVAAGEKHLFRIDEFLIRPGERVALLGHNGVGKSTFIRALMQGTNDKILLRPQTTLGYYDQELESVSSQQEMLDFVVHHAQCSNDRAKMALIRAGFAYALQTQRINSLSGGERARVLFAVLSLQAPNFLVLDEPTNHIDLEGKEQLEDQLVNSTAAVLLTSHDRRFIENVAQRWVWINQGQLVELTDPALFFNSPNNNPANLAIQENQPAKLTTHTLAADKSVNDSDLQRLVELEEKLAADLARKIKFQKPDRQAQWQAEIQSLYTALEGD